MEIGFGDTYRTGLLKKRSVNVLNSVDGGKRQLAASTTICKQEVLRNIQGGGLEQIMPAWKVDPLRAYQMRRVKRV